MCSSNLFFCIELFPTFFIVQNSQSPHFSGPSFFWVQVFLSLGFSGLCFSGSRFFKVQVFLSPGFSGSKFFRVLVFQGQGFSGTGSRVRVQGLGPGFRSNHYIIISLIKLSQTLSRLSLSNSLKSDIFFNSIFIPCFSRFMYFRVHVFQAPGFSRSIFFRIQVFQGPSFSGSRFFRVQVFQGPDAGSGSRFQKQPRKTALYGCF